MVQEYYAVKGWDETGKPRGIEAQSPGPGAKEKKAGA